MRGVAGEPVRARSCAATDQERLVAGLHLLRQSPHRKKFGDIEGADPALLLKHFRFSSDIDMGWSLSTYLAMPSAGRFAED